MLDIAMVKGAIDLVKELGGFIEWTGKRRRTQFEKIIEPLFQRLEVIAKEYYATVAQVRQQIGAKDADLVAIFKAASEKRALLVIARNGILGETQALRGSIPKNAQTPSQAIDPFDEQLAKFVENIHLYFINPVASPSGYQDDPATLFFRKRFSLLTALLQELRISKSGDLNNSAGQRLRAKLAPMVAEKLQHLENQWTEIASSFAKLKMLAQQ